MRIRQFAAGIVVSVMMLLLLSTSSAQTAKLAAAVSPAALEPWKVQTFDGNANAYNISAAFGGPKQIPMFSYIQGGLMRLAKKPLVGTPNCGPGTTWSCETLHPNPPDAGTVTWSPLATHTISTTFYYGWAYQNVSDGDLYYYFGEADSNGVWLTSHWYKLLTIGDGVWTGYTLKGRPSLVFDGNAKPRVAVVLHNSNDTYDYVVYIHPATTNTSCGFSTNFSCERIEYLYSVSGTPILALTDNGVPRIAYYDENGDYLRYAYPESIVGYVPNCGPSPAVYTWRCIDILQGVGTAIIGENFSMAVGSGEPQLSFTLKDTLSQTWLIHAYFVGAAGNCGRDYVETSPGNYAEVYRWQCNQVAQIYNGTPLYKSLSMQVDPLDYAVMAVNYDNGFNFDLRVFYPNERIGGSGGYAETRIEGGPLNNGMNAALALNSGGVGFAAYVQDEEWSPNLKIAMQSLHIFLPMIKR
jgi:hypothetical protein